MTIALANMRPMDCDPSYAQLKRHIIDSTGLAYYLDKDAELISQLVRRMAALEIADCSTYLQLLCAGRAGEAEHDALAEGLTIGETSFFRHQEVFDAIRDRVVPELIERNRQCRRLRFWSAGCATGAEAYSLAILLRREFGQQLADWNVTILATDINRAFLAQGQQGKFSDWAFRSAPDDLKYTCFVRSGQSWRIKDEYRRGVSFQYHNLVQHPFPSLINSLSAFDLVLCRNVMIYFEPAIVCRLVEQFQNCLVDGGWFLVGPTEPSVELFRGFQTVNSPGAVLYRKGPPAAVPAALSPPAATWGSEQATHNGQPPVNLGANFEQANTQVPDGNRRPRARRPSRFPTKAMPATLAEVCEKLNGGQFAAAAESCRQLMATDRLNPFVYFYHALAAEQQGHQADIEPDLRRAIYLDRDFVLAHYHLGLVLQRNRDTQAAQRSLRNVLELLESRDESQTFPDADGLTVGDLRQLTRMHLEVLEHA